MKFLLCFIFLLTISQKNFAQQKDYQDYYFENYSLTDSLEARNIEGKVKSMKVVFYTFVLSKNLQDTIKSFMPNYDKGYITYFNNVGKPVKEFIYKINYPIYFPVADSSFTYLQYHENGKLKQIENSDEIKEYNKYGDIKTSSTFFYEEGFLPLDFFFYKYDNDGNKLKMDEFSNPVRTGRPEESATYKYDESGNLIQETSKGGLENLSLFRTGAMTRKTYNYDEDGKIKKIAVTGGGDLTLEMDVYFTYSWGELEHVKMRAKDRIKHYYFEDGRIIKKVLNIEKNDYYNQKKIKKEKVETYTYLTEDNEDNWTKLMIEISNEGNPDSEKIMIERTFKYHD
jgi:YD repeat-containing protein